MFELLIGCLIFIFYVLRSIGVVTWHGPRRNRTTFVQCGQLISGIAQRWGGILSPDGWRHLRYTPEGKNWQLEVNCDSRNRLSIRYPKAFSFYASWIRLRPLPYAFLEAFLSEDVRAGGEPYFVFTSDKSKVAKLNRRPGFLPLMKKLWAAGFSIQIGTRGAVLWKRIERRDLSQESLENLMRISENFFSLADPQWKSIPVHSLPSERRCAYCKESFSQQGPLQQRALYCTGCGTPHHADCFELNGRCSVFGCEEPLPRYQAERRLENFG